MNENYCMGCENGYPLRACSITGEPWHRGPDQSFRCYAQPNVTVTRSQVQNAVMKALQDLGIFCLATGTGLGASHYEVAENAANILLLAGKPV